MTEREQVLLISYRHADAPLVRALQMELRVRYGDDVVLRDIEVEPFHGHLVAVVSDLVAAASVVLVVIGSKWLRSASAGRGAIDRDWVRLEVSLALAWGREVVPVLLEGAIMPPRSSLPTDLAALADRLAVRLRDSDWEADLERLWVRLEGE